MARTSYVWRDGKWVDKRLIPPPAPPAARSNLPTPMFISDKLGDDINGLWHPSTGEWMDSKSRFRAETEARGLTEMGNEAFPVNRGPTEAEHKAEVAQAIADTYDMIEAGALKVEDAKPVNPELINADLAKASDAAL